MVEDHSDSEGAVTLESPMRAMPTDSFRFMPPDSVRDWAPRLSVRPMQSNMLSTSLLTFSLATPFSYKTKYYGIFVQYC